MKPGPWRWRRVDLEGSASALLLETTQRPVKNNDPCILAVREDWIRDGAIDQSDLNLIAAAPRLKSFFIRVLATIETLDNFGPGYGDRDAIKQIRADIGEFADLLGLVVTPPEKRPLIREVKDIDGDFLRYE